MTSTVKPKAKFSSRNLSAVYKAPSPSLKPSDNAGAFYPSASRMLVIGRSAGSSAAAPAPLNTPSLRKEHYQSPGPTGSPARAGWAVPSAVTPLRLHESASDAEAAGNKANMRPERPTHAPSEPGNVWASGHAAEVINPEVANHHHAVTPTAPTGRFARSPFVGGTSGRWGDDAVEQDIERRDREKEMRRHREFPDLKEAAQLAAPHSEEHHDGGGGRFQDRRRLDADRPTYHNDRFDRGFYRDADDSRLPFHNNDRFERDGGYGRFDPPRRFDAPPAPMAGGPHTHFSPSDARFDGFIARHEVERPLPSFGGASRAGSSHGSATSASELDVNHRYPSPPHYSFLPEDHHRQHHEAVVDRSPSRSVTPALPSRAVDQPFHSREDARLPSSEHEDQYHDSSNRDEPVNWRQRSTPSETVRPEQSVAMNTAPPTNSQVAHVDGDKHERKNSSLSRTSSSSSAGKPSASSAAGGSTNAQPAVESPQVRILKRMGPAPSGPKMLFDPKTGGMVSAEKEEAAPGGRRRKQQQQPTGKKPSVEADNTSPAKEDAPMVKKEESTPTTKAVATLLVGDMELPIHDVSPASFRLGADTKDGEQPASEATIELKSAAANESSSSVQLSSLETLRDGKKPNPRRREAAAAAKPSKAPARGKPEARPLERVKVTEHRSRSESVEKKPKRESRQTASASPSVPPAATQANRDREKKEKRPAKGNPNQDSKPGKQRAGGADGEAEKKTERRANQPRSDKSAAAKHDARTVVVTDKPSNRSVRRSRRSGKREAHADGQQSERVPPIDASTSLRDDEGVDHGFQTVKSRRVVLSEKKQQRQQEPLVAEVETKVVASADGSTRSRKQKVRKAEQDAETKSAPVKSAAPAAAKTREAKRSERQPGGEQASEKPHASAASQRPSRRRDGEHHGPDGKPPRTVDGEAGATATPSRGKRKANSKGKPSGEAATTVTSGAVAKSASTPRSVAAPAGVKHAGKTEGKPQHKPAGRKVYVAKAPPAPALSAA